MEWTPEPQEQHQHTPRTRASSTDITSTPVANQRSVDAACASPYSLFSPISSVQSSPGCDLSRHKLIASSRISNVWLETAERESRDSGYGTRNTHSFTATLPSSSSLAPLSIDIPAPSSPNEAPSSRDAMFANLDADFSRYVLWFAHREPIGKRVGESQFDIVTGLQTVEKSGLVLGSHLLPFLGAADLRSMRLVSRAWRQAVIRHSNGRWRRSRGSGRYSENCFQDVGCASEKKCDRNCSPFLRRGALLNTQRSAASPADGQQEMDAFASPEMTPRDRFQSASSGLLSSEHLGRCPGCFGPSRVTPWDRTSHCAPGGCGGVFCSFCGYAAHGKTRCQRRISPTRSPPPLAPAGSPEKRLRRKLLKRL